MKNKIHRTSVDCFLKQYSVIKFSNSQYSSVPETKDNKNQKNISHNKQASHRQTSRKSLFRVM